MPDTKLEENIISEQVKRLQKVLTFRTISKLVKEEEVENGLACFDDPNPLHELHKYIREQFPEIFSTPERVSVELINEGSFLIHVKKNSNKSEKLDRNVNEQNETVEQNGEIETEQNGEIESEQKESDSANLDSGPFLLIAHMDVVPTVDKEWKHPPFEGIIEDGYLYGRGALDDKGALMAMLEATSSLIRDENFVCKRDFYIALTHDEEVKGNLGAKNVAPKLEKVLEGKKLDFILDEGLVVFEDFRPGFPPIAFVAICEKGHLDLKITVKTPAGHSSLPQASTAVTKMCEIVTKLNKFSFPIYLKGTPMHGSLNVLSPFFSAAQRTLINSIGMSDTIMKKIISSDRLSATLMQTTKVVTKIEGGTSGNVIPSECSANVNFRLHPNDTCDRVMETVKKLVGSNEVTIEKMDSRDPPKCSSTDSVAYDRIVKAVGETFKECEVKPVVAPNLLTGQTDSRHFQHLTRDTYRFTPYYMKRADIQSIHGHNERIGIDNYHQVIEFFTRFIRETAFETRKEVSNQ